MRMFINGKPMPVLVVHVRPIQWEGLDGDIHCSDCRFGDTSGGCWAWAPWRYVARSIAAVENFSRVGKTHGDTYWNFGWYAAETLLPVLAIENFGRAVDKVTRARVTEMGPIKVGEIRFFLDGKPLSPPLRAMRDAWTFTFDTGSVARNTMIRALAVSWHANPIEADYAEATRHVDAAVNWLRDELRRLEPWMSGCRTESDREMEAKR